MKQKDSGTRANEYLFVSDFDQTLSFNDSGIVLSELLGLGNFAERINGLSNIHLVQQGAELAYLLLHDPEYRRVRREHLIEVGKRIRLKQNIQLLSKLIENIDGRHFSFFVVSAAPQEVIQSALEGIVPEDHIFGTQFRYAALDGRDRIDRAGLGGLRQSGRRGRAAFGIDDQPRPRGLRRRRQFGRPRHDAHQPSERHDHRRF